MTKPLFSQLNQSFSHTQDGSFLLEYLVDLEFQGSGESISYAIIG